MGHAHTSGRSTRMAAFTALITLALMLALSGIAVGASPSAPTPVNTAAPTVTGTPVPGQTLTCSTGTWTNTPTGYSYAWLRDGAPIAGQTAATYVVQAADQGHSLSCKVTASNEGGDYTISSLPSGSYKVSFTTESEGGNYLKQFFNGKSTEGTADSVAVTAPNAMGAINAELHAGGQISGRVIDAVSKASIAGVLVCVEQTGSKPEFGRCEATNGNGEYTVAGLPTASYDVVFYSFTLTTSYRMQFYNGKSKDTEAEPVAVTVGATTSGINAELRPYNEGASIEGTVTKEAKPSEGIENIEVCANPLGEIFVGECTTTNPSGKYVLSGLGAGETIVSFSGRSCSHGVCKSVNYVSQYYQNSATYVKATPITLVAGKATPNINAQMAEGGGIGGTVTDETSHLPLGKVSVCAYGVCESTDANGKYLLLGLPKASYTVDYHLAAGTNYLSLAATGVTVEVGPVPTTKNVELARGGQIAGRVTDAASHAPIAGIEVCVNGFSVPCATTDGSGEYMLSRLNSGTYEVSYHVEENEKLDYLPQTRGGVAVTQGTTTTGINAELSPGGQITGRVTDAATHAGVTRVSVCAEEIGGSKAFQCASTTSGGASASATSSALAVPKLICTSLKKAVFVAKGGQLEFFFNCATAGKLSWSLSFKNADVGFTDSLGISLGQSAFSGEAGGVAEAAKKKGKGRKAKKCKPGFIKHKGKCKRKLVPFGGGSQSVPAGAVLVKVHASAAALKGLKQGHTLHISGTFTFRSSLGGAPTTLTVQATIHPPKKHGGKRGKHKKK